MIIIKHKIKKKLKYPPSNSKIFRKVKGSIKYKIITSKTGSHSHPKPALNYCYYWSRLNQTQQEKRQKKNDSKLLDVPWLQQTGVTYNTAKCCFWNNNVLSDWDLQVSGGGGGAAYLDPKILRGPCARFLKVPENFSGPKSNIKIKIWRMRAWILASKLLYFVSLTDRVIMLDPKLLKPLSCM